MKYRPPPPSATHTKNKSHGRLRDIEHSTIGLVHHWCVQFRISISIRGIDCIIGASSGLGQRLAKILLARNDKVVATARDVEKLDDLPKSENLRTQQLDVTDGPDVLKTKAQEAVEFFGRIDVLVNNAGIGCKAFIEEAGWVLIYLPGIGP